MQHVGIVGLSRAVEDNATGVMGALALHGIPQQESALAEYMWCTLCRKPGRRSTYNKCRKQHSQELNTQLERGEWNMAQVQSRLDEQYGESLSPEPQMRDHRALARAVSIVTDYWMPNSYYALALRTFICVPIYV